MFQHTAARRRLLGICILIIPFYFVSTHSRAEAAAVALTAFLIFSSGFNTQPRGGGCAALAAFLLSAVVSTHSRAEAAA